MEKVTTLLLLVVLLVVVGVVVFVFDWKKENMLLGFAVICRHLPSFAVIVNQQPTPILLYVVRSVLSHLKIRNLV